MKAQVQMGAILFFIVLIEIALACDVDDVAVYKVRLETFWSEERFPKDYPLYRPKAQWSQVFGQSHNSSYALYRVGEVARPSVRQFAQFAKVDDLVLEGDEESKVYDQFSAPAIGNGVGVTENVVFVDGGHSLISLMSRLIPSPDWFVGVEGLDLCVDSTWLEELALDLQPLDAGAASGLTFTAPRWETSPPAPVSRHAPRRPDHPAAGFYYPELKELPTIAKLEFFKIKEYSTKELNNLARKEMINLLRRKENRGFFKKVTVADLQGVEEVENKEFQTKSPLEQLKGLEEDPVGTPRPNVADNRVIVVTASPTEVPPTDQEFDSNLKSMDDVVLAVARGRHLGLGRHLPRHFRSRLHHAVNRIQPNDCHVSAWSDWTPCSVTCGFGEQLRTRSVEREKREGGRDCPVLQERRHCGDVNSCASVEYFEW